MSELSNLLNLSSWSLVTVGIVSLMWMDRVVVCLVVGSQCFFHYLYWD